MDPNSEIAKPPEESEAHNRTFEDRRLDQTQVTGLALGVMVLPVFVLLCLNTLQVKFDPGWLGIIFLAVLGPIVLASIGLAWFSRSNWRCPACNRFLHVVNPFIVPDSFFCPYCGTKLK